ncbi:hypothetical protein [Agrococcus lahaulensis]|uniref:hypothetical protein n=1 Tax=Agrococcus lahaulensis TaxID=341722 RepID=UPI00047D289A|nr:hypothetical protein [Agrococcus lahaulensis]
MSDQQSTSWRDRFFGTAPLSEATPDERIEATGDADASEVSAAHSAELAPDSTEAATATVDEHDEHQPLVEHEPEADTAVLERPAPSDSPIEPTVIAPSTLRGPSHSAAHPDDSARSTAAEVHGEAASSSLEGEPVEPAEPPALVEPRRPSFGLRRHGDAGAPGASLAGLTEASVAAGAASDDRDRREFVEPEPTQAIDAQRRDDDATRAMDTVDDPAVGATDDAPTRAMDAQADEPTQALEQPQLRDRSNRFGIVRDDVRDEVPASATGGDDATAGAAASGAPIVLVEEPVPPRRKGARGVGLAVVLLATLVFALLLAAAAFAVGYLFDRQFDAAATLQSLWLRPSYLLPVIVFFVGYLILSLIANRAGWWAHVLGGFVVALLTYAAHIAGAHMESEGGWGSFAAVAGIDAASLGQLLLAPLSVLAFVIAREVPIWVGGIQSRRGRRAREHNRQAMDEFNSEHAERLAAYERARG